MTEKQFPHLADVGFERMAPSPALRPFVQWYWSIRSNGRISHMREEFMHADGSVGLVFNWGDALQLNGSYYPQAATINGVWLRSQRLQLAGQVEAFGILFQPGGAFPLFGMPLDELVDTAVLPAYLPPNQLSQLHEQLYVLPTMTAKAVVVEKWLMQRLIRGQETSPLVNSSLAMLTNTHGQLPIQHVADSVYVSVRQLERLFKTQVGLSPKKYGRLMRMRQAREALKQNHTLVDVAHAHGFYDQAHFIREFNSVIGMTPGAYLSRRESD